MEWLIPNSYTGLNHLAPLDILMANEKRRPIYYAMTTSPDTYVISWNTSVATEGVAERLMTDMKWSAGPYGIADTEVNLAFWRKKMRLENKDKLLGSESEIMYNIHFRSLYGLAVALESKGDTVAALEVLSMLDQGLPDEQSSRGYTWFQVVNLLAKCGNLEQAEKIGLQIIGNYDRKTARKSDAGMESSARIQLKIVAEQYKLEKLKQKLR
ncbi:MAG: hypothetical protein IPL65_08100 [Lewinellaceae bacterium]|nr:hypothetical protein [Lewinellaceae bacterium]